MDKTTIIKLKAPKYKTDALSQLVPDGETTRELFCSKQNVKRSEWLAAAQRGLKAAWCVTIWADEYQGETVAILDGVRYGIYRTYQASADELELYLEQKVGVCDGCKSR